MFFFAFKKVLYSWGIMVMLNNETEHFGYRKIREGKRYMVVNAHQEAVSDIPDDFLSQFSDCTYGNDQLAIFCKRLGDTGICLVLYIDYPKLADRENQNYKRFSLFSSKLIHDGLEYEQLESENLLLETECINELTKLLMITLKVFK